MTIKETGFDGLLEIEPKIFSDNRGYFFESYNQDYFLKNNLNLSFVQDNQSLSYANVVRGMHFQLPPYEQGKLVRVITGRALDVVVDLRTKQPTYGRHYKCILDSCLNNMLWIPPGFAHGFLTLEDNTIFFYKCTNIYNRESEMSILWNDPDLGINWGAISPIVSAKDSQAINFRDFKSLF